MKNFLLISYCIEAKLTVSCMYEYEFHFIGVYNGLKIRRIVLNSTKHLEIKKTDEVVLYLKCFNVKNGVLFSDLIYFKQLSSISLF